MTEISNPHDRFFKDVLSRREAALDFVLYYLPADITVLLDIESLVVCKDSFVDKDLNPWHNNCLTADIPKMSNLILFAGCKNKKKSPVFEDFLLFGLILDTLILYDIKCHLKKYSYKR